MNINIKLNFAAYFKLLYPGHKKKKMKKWIQREIPETLTDGFEI